MGFLPGMPGTRCTFLVHSSIQSLYSCGDVGEWVVDIAAVPLWFHPWAGMCWGCMGSTRGCARSAAGSRDFPIMERAWENLLV